MTYSSTHRVTLALTGTATNGECVCACGTIVVEFDMMGKRLLDGNGDPTKNCMTCDGRRTRP